MLQNVATCAAVSWVVTVPTISLADQMCEISSDVGLYFERVEQAIILMQYQDIVVRAVDGKISCREDIPNTRQDCLVDGPGEILIEAETGLFVVRMEGPEHHAVHIYATGDLSCGLASQME